MLNKHFAFFAFFALLLLSSRDAVCQQADSTTAGVAAPDPVTMAMLNGDYGVFTTYQDFLDGKKLNLKFQSWSYLYTGGKNLKYLKARFKDENGKTVVLDCDEFWGYKCNTGFYRSVPFKTGDVTRVCFSLVSKNDQYYVWQALNDGQLHFTPDMMYSEGINGKQHLCKADNAPAATGMRCRETGIIAAPNGRVEWTGTMANFKKCASMKYALYCEHEGKMPANYFGVIKDNDPPVWKYVAVNP